MALEKVVTGNEDHLLRIGGGGDNLLQRLMGAELVVVAADEQLRLGAVVQEPERIEAALGFNRSSQRDQRTHVNIGAAGPQPDGGAEGKAGKDDGKPKLELQPRQGSLYVAGFIPAIVLPGAQSRPAEVEPQNGKAERMQCLHGVKDDLVVHRAAEHGVRMADQSGVSSRRRAHIKQSFQPSYWAVEKE